MISKQQFPKLTCLDNVFIDYTEFVNHLKGICSLALFSDFLTTERMQQ